MSYLKKVILGIIILLVPIQSMANQDCSIRPPMLPVFGAIEQDLKDAREIISKDICTDNIFRGRYYSSKLIQTGEIYSRIIREFGQSVKKGAKSAGNIFTLGLWGSVGEFYPRVRETQTFDTYVEEFQQINIEGANNCSLEEEIIDPDTGEEVSVMTFVFSKIRKVNQTKKLFGNISKIPEPNVENTYFEESTDFESLRDFYSQENVTTCPDPETVGKIKDKVVEIKNNSTEIWTNLKKFGSESAKIGKNFKEEFSNEETGEFELAQNKTIFNSFQLFSAPYESIRKLAEDFWKANKRIFTEDEDVRLTQPSYYFEEKYRETPTVEARNIEQVEMDSAIDAISFGFDEISSSLSTSNRLLKDLIYQDEETQKEEELYFLSELLEINTDVCKKIHKSYCKNVRNLKEIIERSKN